MTTVDPRRYNLFFTDKSQATTPVKWLQMHSYLKTALLFCSQLCESKLWGDTAGQSLLGVSQGSTITCCLGCRYRGALLAWMSLLAYSQGCQPMLSAGAPLAYWPEGNMWPFQHIGLRAVRLLRLIPSRMRVPRELPRDLASEITEPHFHHARWVEKVTIWP